MDFLNRREFINRSAILSAATASAALAAKSALAETKPVAAAAGQTDKLRIAVCGVRSRGVDAHVPGYLAPNNNCEITTICDCDEAVIGKAMKAVEGKQGKAPNYVKDIRKVVEDKNIDAISIAMPNHWHALAAVWAMENGKDVYVEKPASHTIREGAIMLAAARKYKKICQVGMQSRSNPAMHEAIAAVRGGKIGKVDFAIGLCYKPRASIGKVTGPQKPPATMDYDLWTGPAAMEMPHRNGKFGPVHYDWHWIWNYGNGDLGNQGVHQMDVARWGLGKTTMPASAFSFGGRVGYVDDGQTANTQLSVFDYGDSKMAFEVRGLKTDKYKGADIGVIWVGTEGMVVCPHYYETAIIYDKDGKEVKKIVNGSDQFHFDNFVKVVRSRSLKEQNADIAEGHLSAALCHLANISYQLGVEQPIGKTTDVSDDKRVNAMAVAMIDHLKANNVDPATAMGRFGPVLKIDPKTEKFIGNDKANALLTREYRKGFELKEIA